MKCEISFLKCKFNIILFITDYQRDFCSCVVVFFRLSRWTTKHQQRQKIYSVCFVLFSSTNCDGFCLMAAFPAARVQQLFPQLFPHHISSRCTLPGSSSLEITSLLVKGPWMKTHLQSAPQTTWWQPTGKSERRHVNQCLFGVMMLSLRISLQCCTNGILLPLI